MTHGCDKHDECVWDPKCPYIHSCDEFRPADIPEYQESEETVYVSHGHEQFDVKKKMDDVASMVQMLGNDLSRVGQLASERDPDKIFEFALTLIHTLLIQHTVEGTPADHHLPIGVTSVCAHQDKQRAHFYLSDMANRRLYSVSIREVTEKTETES